MLILQVAPQAPAKRETPSEKEIESGKKKRKKKEFRSYREKAENEKSITLMLMGLDGEGGLLSKIADMRDSLVKNFKKILGKLKG